MSFEPMTPRDGKSFPLAFPFKWDGEPYQALSLRRPMRGDISAYTDAMASINTKGQVTAKTSAAMDKLIADLAEVPIEVVRHLEPTDSAKITAWLDPIIDPKDQASTASGN